MQYIFSVSIEQIKILSNRQKISAVISDPKTDLSTRTKLQRVLEAKSFAINKLSLNEKGGFDTYVKLDRNEVGWNVSASKRLALESYTWWFPFAGTVPYKGFFDKKMALECESELKEKGYDTRIRTIGGYSTLGWFSDPILSPQLQQSDTYLTGLVFHEMAHATVYIPGDSTFNESYASFVEEVGLDLFLKERNLEDRILEFRKEKDLRKKQILLLQKFAKKLESIYQTQKSEEAKLEAKKETILEFQKEWIQEKLISPEKADLVWKKDWNNEDFLGALRYHSGEDFFQRIFLEEGQDFSRFHKRIQEIAGMSSEERKRLFYSGKFPSNSN